MNRMMRRLLAIPSKRESCQRFLWLLAALRRFGRSALPIRGESGARLMYRLHQHRASSLVASKRFLG
jgi:hypothetical protein